MTTEKNDDELGFVLSHYQEHRFSAEEALKRMEQQRTGQTPRRPALRRWVAAAASVLCLTVLAGVLTWQRVAPAPQPESPAQPAATTAAPQPPAAAQQAQTASFHFDDTPLPQVLAVLGQHYGAHLTASDTTRHLTGDFSGESLPEILGMIEEVLDVNISLNGK